MENCINNIKLQPVFAVELLQILDTIFQDKNHHVFVAEENGKIISSCVCVFIPNMTHNQQAYAFVENVITDEKFRKRGLAVKFQQLFPINLSL